MKTTIQPLSLRSTLALLLLLLPCACATAPPASPPATSRPADRHAPETPQAPEKPAAPEKAAPSCKMGTFGLETVDASRALRRAHGVSLEVRGAMVIEVLPGSPVHELHARSEKR